MHGALPSVQPWLLPIQCFFSLECRGVVSCRALWCSHHWSFQPVQCRMVVPHRVLWFLSTRAGGLLTLQFSAGLGRSVQGRVVRCRAGQGSAGWLLRGRKLGFPGILTTHPQLSPLSNEEQDQDHNDNHKNDPFNLVITIFMFGNSSKLREFSCLIEMKAVMRSFCKFLFRPI